MWLTDHCILQQGWKCSGGELLELLEWLFATEKHNYLVSKLHLALLELVLSLENIKILELKIEISQDLFYKVFSWNLI